MRLFFIMDDNWEGLYGQAYIKNILGQFAASGKVPHALLFHGSEGTGKDYAALKFAQLLNSDCSNPDKVFRAIGSLSEPYIKYIFPLPRGKNETEDSGPLEKLSSEEIQTIRTELEKKASNPYYSLNIPKASGIKVNSIRDIKKFLSFDFSEIKSRVILISNAHLMNEESQNALLKGLEEPPEGTYFVLTTPRPSALRETIRSRCWMLHFNPLSEDDIVSILTRYFETDKLLAEKIAPFAGGSVTTALSLIENDFEELLNNTILLLRYSFGRKYHSALSVFDPYLKEADHHSIKLLMNMVLVWLNDFQRFRVNAGEKFYKEHRETLDKFNNRYPGIQINSNVTNIEKLISLFRNNVNVSTIIINLVMELSSIVITSPPKKK